MARLFYSWIALSIAIFIAATATADTVKAFTLSSTSFTDQQNIPALYTCDGKNISPPMSWSNAPTKTASFALICQDPDAPAGVWYHWVVYNLPASVTSLPEGALLPAGAAMGKNSWGHAEYSGPCPPHPSTHRYIFTLYALDRLLPLPNGADLATLENAMHGHVLEKTTIFGVFGR